MIKYEIGKRFPHEKYLGKGEVTIAILNTAFFDALCVLDGISANERKDWRKGKLGIYLYEQSDIPFVCFAFENWNFDISINIGKATDEQVEEWLNSEANLINLFLVDATTGTLEAMRMISIPRTMAERIRDICEDQSSRTFDQTDSLIHATIASISTEFMINNAEMRYKL
jgi:alpha-acetolactate decarboxylase